MHNDIRGRILAVIRKSFIIGLVSIMPFSNSILAGETLVRNAEQSEGFQTGVTGWRITRLGDAEFNNLIARGELIVGPVPGQHIHVGRDALGRPIVEFYSGNVNETNPGFVRTSTTGETALQLASPLNNAAPVGSILPEVDLQSWPGSPSTMNLWADQIRVNVPVWMDSNWFNIPLANSWVDLAGARANYFEDATGRIQMRGEVINGVTGVIATMPAGARPSQTMEWIMRGVGGVVMCAVSVSTTGVMTVTANLATAQGSGIRLDSISYPTLP